MLMSPWHIHGAVEEGLRLGVVEAGLCCCDEEKLCTKMKAKKNYGKVERLERRSVHINLSSAHQC